MPDDGDDHGQSDPAVAAALATYAATGSAAAAFAALSRSRVLVPVVAEATPHEPQSSTHMATVLLTGRDGRQALLAFTGLESLARWRSDARPVPRPAAEAARAAVAEGAAALLLDVAGPVPLAVEGDDLHSFAAGLVLIDTGTGHAWAVPAEDPGWYLGP